MGHHGAVLACVTVALCGGCYAAWAFAHAVSDTVR
jgi:hypothetical protein